jgi:glycosyltransferase involved in cell wall biosynthesis
MNEPSVSVIVPTYNCGPYLVEAIDSVLDQSLKPSEVIVVDDGSTDDTPAVLEKYAGRMTVIRQTNAGVSAARNRALESVHGEFVALMDADDVSTSDRFAKQVATLRSNPQAVACFSGYWKFQRESGTRQEVPPPKSAGPNGKRDFLAAIRELVVSVPLPGTMMFRRQPAASVRYPLGVKLGEDVLFCAMLRSHGEFVVVPEPLYGYHTSAGSASRTQTPLDSFEQRFRWVMDNAEQYCPGRPLNEVSAELWNGLADVAESLYWSRQRDHFLTVRTYLRANWPAGFPEPRAMRRRWYPDWAWAAKERVSRAMRGAGG